jgi:hypothetical protein
MKLSTPNFKEKHLILYKHLKEPRADLKHKKTNRIKNSQNQLRNKSKYRI